VICGRISRFGARAVSTAVRVIEQRPCARSAFDVLQRASVIVMQMAHSRTGDRMPGITRERVIGCQESLANG
jgi:hypothetical protein